MQQEPSALALSARAMRFYRLAPRAYLFLANDGYTPNPAGGVHSFCHALPGRWHQMSVILSAASCVDWAVKLCGMADAAAMFAAIEARGTPASTEMFLPYLSGERTPHNDPNAKGVLFGLTHESDAAAIGQAVLEGVAFAFRDGMDALIDSGAHIDSITVIGGGATSHYWGRILASVLDRPLIYRDGGEVGPAYGAARLARSACRRSTIEEVCTAPAIINMSKSPMTGMSIAMPRQIPKFRTLYQNSNHLFTEKT